MASVLSPPSSSFPSPLLWPPCLDKTSPPNYSPSAAVPAYSVVPRPSERILAATARLRRRAPTGVYVRSNNLITVALREQEQDASMPLYGRHGIIWGDIALSCTTGVQAVYIKVRACERPPFWFCIIRCLLFFFFLFSWKVDYTWPPHRKAQWRTRRSSASRMMCGDGRTRTAAVRRVRACSRSRPCCRRDSRITDRDARCRPRTITRRLRLRTPARSAPIAFWSSSSARGAGWHSGSFPKSEFCVWCGRSESHRRAVSFVSSASELALTVL